MPESFALPAEQDEDIYAFPTLISKRYWQRSPEANPVMSRLVLDREKDDAGTVTTNVGGWRSGEDFLRWPHEVVGQWHEWVLGCFADVLRMITRDGRAANDPPVRTIAWANTNRRGDFKKMHLHQERHWAGVYYVDIPNDNDRGRQEGFIDFLDPRNGAAMMPVPHARDFPPRITVEPAPGMLLMFPSWLYHSVNPHYSERPRISIGIDFIIGAAQTAPRS
jgi:uncharacterized protein (TIGR02466 family)